jgi:signal transduction histidine kinase
LGYFNEVIDYIRRLSQDLSPAILEDLGLAPASKRLLEEFCNKNQCDACSRDLDEIDGLFSPAAEINIYRILQEALTNISKHARATAVSLSIKKRDHKVVVTLEDNGVGFEVGQVLNQGPPDQRVGLTAMAERVRMLGGTLEIWSQVGQGPRISLDIPVDRESIQ